MKNHSKFIALCGVFVDRVGIDVVWFDSVLLTRISSSDFISIAIAVRSSV